jgi:putative endonuclease
MLMYYVYVLKNNNEFYIGYTEDLIRRLKQHNSGRGNNLVYYEAYVSKKQATQRENKLKYYGSAWRALKQRILA